jgi:hypothetical protein
MMSLRTWAKRLRIAADAIDAIFEQPGTPDIAEAIRRQVVERPARVYAPRNTRKFNYHGKHWTQQPENRAKVVALAKLRAKARKAS